MMNTRLDARECFGHFCALWGCFIHFWRDVFNWEPSANPCRYEDTGEELVMWQSVREMLLRVISGTQVPPPAYNKIDPEVADLFLCDG